MRPILIAIFLLINCAVSTAQSYYFKSFDLDTGANLILKATFDPFTKGSVITSKSLLWHKIDSFNTYKSIVHFNKLNFNKSVEIDKTIENTINIITVSGNIKLKQGGYLSYGSFVNKVEYLQGFKSVYGCIVLYSNSGDSLLTRKYKYGNNNSSFISARQLKDSSIVLISFLSNDSNIFSALRVIKLDTAFNTLWDSVYYYSLNSNRNEPRISSFVDAIEETSDGGLIIGSSIRTRTSAIDYHGFYFKINSQGQKQWERKFEFARDSETEVNKIIKLQDGNFLLVGFYNDFWTDPNHIDFIFLTKINPSGDILWSKFVKAYKYHFIYDALEKPNGDLVLAGTFAKGLNGFDYEAGLMCLNSQGNIKWHRLYTLPSNLLHTKLFSSDFTDIEIANDGTIMAVGNIAVIDSTFPYNNGGNQDILFLYTDSNGCVDPTNCSFTTVEEEHVVPYYFQAYPNPSHGVFKFSTNIPLASSTRIKIYNSFGQLIFEKENIDFTEALDLSNYPKGMYILELQTEKLFTTQKLLIE